MCAATDVDGFHLGELSLLAQPPNVYDQLLDVLVDAMIVLVDGLRREIAVATSFHAEGNVHVQADFFFHSSDTA